ACDGNWNCPWPYLCLMDGADRGHCGVGRGPGQPCQLYGYDAFNGPESHCAPTLQCYPDRAGVWRCGEGREEGEACGTVPPPKPGPDVNGGYIGCRAGFCGPDPLHGTCQPPRAEGGACESDHQCADGLECFTGECVVKGSAGIPAGGVCQRAGEASCAVGTFCALDDGPSRGLPSTGRCRPYDSEGLPC